MSEKLQPNLAIDFMLLPVVGTLASIKVEQGGISIPGEVYELTSEQYEHLLATEPPNMYPSEVILEDGEAITAMLYPRELVEQHNWPDISSYQGWAAYKQAVGSHK